MDMNHQEPSSGPAEAPARNRLESWKEIAAYLKRDIRTLRRWEKNEGLPVHRHMHDKLPTVYAFKPELDAWWQNGQPRLEQQERIEQAATRKRLWRVLAVTAVAAVGAVAMGLGLWLTRAPVLPFEERDWVLIAQFENRTGESVFDGTLEYALERELSNSRFVNVVPRERIEDTLRLMKKPLDTLLDAAVGREICLRDGGIRALLTGRVEKLDTTYVLSATLVNPSKGVTAASFSEEAVGQREVVGALRRLASRVRGTLGEKLPQIQQSEQMLEKVTTPSLRALQLYSQGMALVNVRNWPQAAEFLERAVAEDPDFASAHTLVAYCYSSLGKAKEAAPHYQRAFALADSTTDRERYFILGSYYGEFLRDNQRAMQAYELLVRLYPDHYWGTKSLMGEYTRAGWWEEANRVNVRIAELRPKDYYSASWVAIWAFRHNELARGETLLRRARELAWPEIAQSPTLSYFPASLEMLPVYYYWRHGEIQQALDRAAPLLEKIPTATGFEREAFAVHLGAFYLALGKLRAAEQVFRQIPDEAMRQFALAQLAYARNDTRALREHLMKAYPQPETAILFARAGLPARAEALTFAIKKQYAGNAWMESGVKIARGEVALARGQTAQAVAPLREGLQALAGNPGESYFLGSESLALAWEQQGNLQEARNALEEASRRKIFVDRGSALSYLRIRFRLAQVYRKLGLEKEARAVEAELRKLLAYADPDFPLLAQLREPKERATTRPTN